MIRIVNEFLYIGGFKAVELAEKFGTPLYVYDLEVVEERYRRLLQAFRYRNFEVLYACKANSNVEILKFLRDLGAGLDAVSPYEVLLGIRVGFKPEKILFTGSSVSDEEMRFVKELGVLVNVDSLSQLKRFGKMFPGSEVSIRVNPGFGLDTTRRL